MWENICQVNPLPLSKFVLLLPHRFAVAEQANYKRTDFKGPIAMTMSYLRGQSGAKARDDKLRINS